MSRRIVPGDNVLCSLPSLTQALSLYGVVKSTKEIGLWMLRPLALYGLDALAELYQGLVPQAQRPANHAASRP